MAENKRDLLLLPPMEREEVEAALARLEPDITEDNCLHGCPLCNAEAKLRAALDHRQVEERVKYSVFEDFGEFQRIVRVEGGGEFTDSLSAARKAAAVARTYAEMPVRIQESKTYRTEWVDVGEKGDG